MSIIILSSRKNPRTAIFAGGFLLIFSLLFFNPAQGQETGERFVKLRREMVDRDLRGRGIKDSRVLAAMEAVPRHRFVPKSQQLYAYEDRPLPIGDGQTISQPYIVAFMTELLQLNGSEKVLEIGTGSGYQTAVLARLANQVFSVEISATLAQRAKKLLQQMAFTNIEIKMGDGFFGWSERAPFEAILVTASAPKVPDALWDQLREGGRLVMPLGEPAETQKLVRVTKVSGQPVTEEITGVVFLPLTGAIQKQAR
jgi:protein-L-isoaspartate(D-aspartate) O-methyltransferase